MSKRLLIIGAGLEQVPAYQLAKQKGHLVVGTDMNPDAPAFEFADDSLIASTRDVEETLGVVEKFTERKSVDGVMTIANDVPYTVASVAERLGLPHADKNAVQLLTNKVQMKTAFVNANVSTPEFYAISSLEELEKTASKIGFPLILKPSDGRGSNGVLYLEEGIDLGWAYRHAQNACSNSCLILERFIEGPQLSVEGMFVDGVYRCVAYADRNYDNLSETKPYIVEDGGTIPSCFDDATLEAIRTVIEAGSKALGLNWGVVKADIVIGNDGDPKIIELAGRLSGNYLATHHIPYAYGVDLVGSVIDQSLGLPVDFGALKPKFKKYLGVRYFFPKSGKITDIKHVRKIETCDDTHVLSVYPKIGDIQKPIHSHGARAGTVMMRGTSYDDATMKAIWAAKTIQFEIEKSS